MKPVPHCSYLFHRIAVVALALMPLVALADPAARVGRVAAVEGAVVFRSDDRGEPLAAAINWPLTAANVITTGNGARSELRIGSTVVRLDGRSELHVLALDDDRIDLYLAHGSAIVRVRNPEILREFSLQTPQGRVFLQQPGRVRIDASANLTRLQAIDAAVRFDASGSSDAGIMVAAGSVLENGNGVSRVLVGTAPRESFDGWSLARDNADDRLVTVRHVSPEATGYEELQRYGAWHESTEYGAVWTPTVLAPGWMPYRSGRWLWVAPWGWTWVDDAPWGYAPSHYGRWVSIDQRWCWAPGVAVARPVWAPALVGWSGGQTWNVTVHSSSPPAGGWFALAPREVYVPPYPASRTYVQQVNIAQTVNVTRVNNFYGPRMVGAAPARQWRGAGQELQGAPAAPRLLALQGSQGQQAVVLPQQAHQTQQAHLPPQLQPPHLVNLADQGVGALPRAAGTPAPSLRSALQPVSQALPQPLPKPLPPPLPAPLPKPSAPRAIRPLDAQLSPQPAFVQQRVQAMHVTQPVHVAQPVQVIQPVHVSQPVQLMQHVPPAPPMHPSEPRRHAPEHSGAGPDSSHPQPPPVAHASRANGEPHAVAAPARHEPRHH